MASVSKTFTSALILRLAEDGLLDLDASVRSYLPTLGISRAITVRELLDHTSGLRDFFFHPRIDHDLLTKPTLVWDAARSLKYLGKPYGKPGTSWHYSNTNYLILGLVAEAVGGGTVAEQLRTRFFTPLGLERTFYQSVEKPKGPLARSYRFVGTDPKLPAIDLSDGTQVVPFTSVVTAAGAAGSIASTSSDLVRWAQALYGGSLLEPATRAEMVGDVVRTAPYKPGVAVRARGPVGRDRGPPDTRAFRSLSRRSGGDPLADRRADRHRRRHEPESVGHQQDRRRPAQGRSPAAIRLHHLPRHPLSRARPWRCLRETLS